MHLRRLLPLALLAVLTPPLYAQYPENLVVENVPAIPPEVREKAERYLEFRSAGFNSWHPVRREMLVTTRFAETNQLHLVRMPLGARTQLTFRPEPVPGGAFQPKTGDLILFVQDVGGGEFYQIFRYDVADGSITLLTDGKSRNIAAAWAKSGKWFAYSSTRRNGTDTDIYVQDPRDPKSARLLLEVKGGGWSVADTSHDDSKLLVGEYVSINESYFYLVDVKTGTKELLTPKGGAEKIAYGEARFAPDGKTIYVTTDKGSDFQRLVAIDLASKKETVLTKDIPWNVESFDVSSDGATIAFSSNEAGRSVLHLIDAATGTEKKAPALPHGVIGGLEFHPNGKELGFSLTSARSPNDAYSVDLASGVLTRWTESETSGLNAEKFIEPELIKIKSFDGLEISGFLYRPDPAKFPGKRPLLFNIHGGPEAQFRPGFLARTNFYLNEMGVAIFFPNVRGSDGYGKKFLTLDNDYKREDSVKDLGAFIEWARNNPALDPERIALTGGSYGGYMVLAGMVHYNDRVRCAHRHRRHLELQHFPEKHPGLPARPAPGRIRRRAG